MSKIYQTETVEVQVGFNCDNSLCPSPFMQCDAYTLEGGYGSTCMDCEQYHFCSLQCLREWLTSGPFASIQQ